MQGQNPDRKQWLADNRKKAFHTEADIYITNHDAVRSLIATPSFLLGFDHIIIDESPAYKHRSSQRSRDLDKLMPQFAVRRALTGTPNSNSILDIWNQVRLIDDGEHLGNNYWKFRSTVCEPVQVGRGANMLQWRDKEGIEDVVAYLIQDIVIRHKFEECLDIPANRKRDIPFQLPHELYQLYLKFKRDAAIQLETGQVTAVHAAALRTKLLQLLSGAVYDEDRIVHLVYSDRYELVLDLIKERPASVCAFTWQHQRDELLRLARRDKICYGLIDGSVPSDERNRVVEAFQAGDLQVIFAHPQAAGHGLTLTRGTATIWPSPTSNAEHFTQFNRRIYRAGQQFETETILVHAHNTVENDVYARLDNRLDRLDSLLSIFEI